MYLYFTDRGIEELEERRGEEQVSMAWLAERLRDFVDLNPGFDVAVDRLASFLARLDDEDDLPARPWLGRWHIGSVRTGPTAHRPNPSPARWPPAPRRYLPW